MDRINGRVDAAAVDRAVEVARAPVERQAQAHLAQGGVDVLDARPAAPVRGEQVELPAHQTGAEGLGHEGRR